MILEPYSFAIGCILGVGLAFVTAIADALFPADPPRR